MNKFASFNTLYKNQRMVKFVEETVQRFSCSSFPTQNKFFLDDEFEKILQQTAKKLSILL